jgi:hypothetical protein
MQFPDNKVMDQVDFANSPLQQQAIGFSEVISKVNDFFRLNCFSVPFLSQFHYTYILPCHQVFIVPNYFLLPWAWQESHL